MAYATGGLIEATDYNNLIGANAVASISQFNSIWAWGANSIGYGQTPISSVSALSTVTAAQWASLVNSINSANIHVNGSSSGLTANTAGQLIGVSAGIQVKINGLYTDRMLFSSNSAVVAGTGLAYAAWSSTSTSSTLTRAFGARASFSTADRARFFFNAGGRLKFNISATSSGSSRSTATAALVGYLGGVALFAANTTGGRTGTGGTLGTNITTQGYYTFPFNANTTAVSVTSTTASYTTDTGSIAVKPNGSQGSFNGNGDSIDFWATLNSTSGANAGGLSFDDTLNVTVTVSIDVSYPEVTNLSNTWGACTITQL